MTRGIVRTRDTHPTYFATVKLGRLVSHDMLQNQRRRPGGNGKPIRFHAVVKVICGDDPAGARHIFDDPGRISGNVLVDVSGDQPGVLVIGTARRIANDKS